MSLNETVSAERVHITFFGLRNAGKSSLVNAVTGQKLSIVSDIRGTTTDPVKKAMELLPLGPVVITDTPGLDDVGELGAMRIKKAMEALARTDVAVLVTDATQNRSELENKLIGEFNKRGLPYLIAYNKADLLSDKDALQPDALYVSALTGENVNELKNRLADFAKKQKKEKYLVADLLSRGDCVVLVVPIDASAPKGRLILPQQQVLRELLDAHCTALVCQPEELSETIIGMKKAPKLVITDSQVFETVAASLNDNVPLTSFSILFARYKGNLPTLLRGANAIALLKNNDKVLIAEGCTHHRQCGDIGTQKLPAWISSYCSAKPEFHFCSGTEFPEDLNSFSLIVHCGGCMLNETEMKNRINRAVNAGVPIVNYGIAIARMHGILNRSIRPFPELNQKSAAYE